ncbi:MAG TPA: type II toxin-antitoxin system VapC family toxin [Geminicoccus sp.]|jgi:hypothetical protein|uniref:type II toxin-antitoxin system VapC family toxin n=1 Tax=Geminicoccus sp. TaxID=2024832 RepID=UPI002E351336|nr:type II toxin-antitoxin system VapC family toxin [Geminicoccus sp.]HEX2528331.1 type II toxin-antitoxin system VapC family toxin [Geminicoccus sp.]
MMYLLDTNVISELMKPMPDDNVRLWVMSTNSSQLFISVISLAEMVFGVERLPLGRRRTVLAAKLDDIRQRIFRANILGFGEDAAIRCGEIWALAQGKGRPPSLADAQIAATASVHSMTVATRDIDDFAAFGVPLVNPFDPKASA